MRTKLGLVISLSVTAAALVVGAAGGASASPEATPTTSTTTTSTPTTTTSTTTTTTTTVPGVGDLPAQVDRPAARDTPFQLTEPPPAPTTTTIPPIDQLPPGSGEGRRIVYSKSNQWVWLVTDDEVVEKKHAVSGRRTWNQPLPGTYSVFSRSSHTCNIKNPNLCWRYMVRFTKGPDGDNIGFHEIPTDTSTGNRVQGDWQLGTPLSGGCIRQSTADALYVWNWAPVGTKVVVLP